eukprot:scaffold867_cov112-Cylindrotheca_fusiformis.AAC.5
MSVPYFVTVQNTRINGTNEAKALATSFWIGETSSRMGRSGGSLQRYEARHYINTYEQKQTTV